MVSPHLAKALERVRKSADFMPTWQVEQVLCEELGENWRDNFKQFDEKPFAAASIGQVHWGKLKDGQEVAVKIQYPGVAKGIESDIDNLVGVINVWDMFPKGMFLDNLVRVAKRELAWEVDYVREAECTRKFRKLLEPFPEYYVPKVIGLCLFGLEILCFCNYNFRSFVCCQSIHHRISGRHTSGPMRRHERGTSKFHSTKINGTVSARTIRVPVYADRSELGELFLRCPE